MDQMKSGRLRSIGDLHAPVQFTATHEQDPDWHWERHRHHAAAEMAAYASNKDTEGEQHAVKSHYHLTQYKKLVKQRGAKFGMDSPHHAVLVKHGYEKTRVDSEQHWYDNKKTGGQVLVNVDGSGASHQPKNGRSAGRLHPEALGKRLAHEGMGGTFADGDGPAERDASMRKGRSVKLARLSHEEAAGHLDKARANHELAAKHLATGNHQLAKDHWAKAKEHLTAAKYSHTELGRHHEMFKALEAGLATMFTECTRPDCHGTNEGRPEPVALDKSMKCPKCGTQYPKDWKGHGDERAKDFPHKFADSDAPKGMDPAHHEVLLKHGYKHTGTGNWGEQHYEHPDGVKKASYNSNSKQTMTQGATHGKVTGMAYHKTAAELDEHLGSEYVKGFAACHTLFKGKPSGMDVDHHEALERHGFKHASTNDRDGSYKYVHQNGAVARHLQGTTRVYSFGGKSVHRDAEGLSHALAAVHRGGKLAARDPFGGYKR